MRSDGGSPCACLLLSVCKLMSKEQQEKGNRGQKKKIGKKEERKGEGEGEGGGERKVAHFPFFLTLGGKMAREHIGQCTHKGFEYARVEHAGALNCTFVGSRTWRAPESTQVPSLVVGACARNVRAALHEHSIAWIERLGRFFAHDAFGVFVYWDDNGDADGTRRVLRRWAERNRQVHLVLAPSLRPPVFYRTQRLALCRNVLLAEAVARLPAHGTMVIYDLDCRVASHDSLLAAASLLNAASSPTWHALTANSHDFYYDQWALRSSLLGLHYDCHFDALAKTRASCRDIAIRIDSKADPFGVSSAFNGLAVYRIGALQASSAIGCRFVGSHKSRNCEHVPLMKCLRSAGMNIGVMPSMIADCGTPPLRDSPAKVKVRTHVFANSSVHREETRHRMPLYHKSIPTASKSAASRWERWDRATLHSI